MANEVTGSCFTVIGFFFILIGVGSIESSYLIYFGLSFIFLGIIFLLTANPSSPPEIHRFCPYCGNNTSLDICLVCGKEID